VIQSKYSGDDKWNFRDESINISELKKKFDNIISTDLKLKVTNSYRIVKVQDNKIVEVVYQKTPNEPEVE
jgi:hypothetical protein